LIKKISKHNITMVSKVTGARAKGFLSPKDVNSIMKDFFKSVSNRMMKPGKILN
jgi:DNA-binding transcriptional regulator GbsR (MarR family)